MSMMRQEGSCHEIQQVQEVLVHIGRMNTASNQKLVLQEIKRLKSQKNLTDPKYC